MQILIADDHQLTVEGYKSILLFSEQIEDNSIFIVAYSCEEAFLKIKENKSNAIFFDLAIIDYSMPSYEEENIFNGVDVCEYLQNAMPNCKTIILTGIMESLPLFEMVKNLKPDAVATKSDVNGEILLKIVQDIFMGEKYRSEFVKKQIELIWESKTFVNELNRKILYYLSIGYKIKEIAIKLSISEIAVKKRISKIKKALTLKEDENILKEAKQRGFI